MKVVVSYHQKYVFRKKAKYINIKVFEIVANKNEAKILTKHIWFDCKSNRNRIAKHVSVKIENYHKSKKDYSWNSSTCVSENSKYVKGVAYTLVIACDEIIPVTDIVWTTMTNAIAPNVSINSDDKKVRYKIDCYILHTVLSLLLLMIAIIWYH